MAKIRNYKEHLTKQLQNPEEAAAYLNAALHDENPHVFLLALRDIADAQGGMSWLAEQAELNRENLYRTFSLNGNPRFFNLLAVLDVIGLELSIYARPKKKVKHARVTQRSKISKSIKHKLKPRPRIRKLTKTS